jgi:hypothetical protein
MVRGVFSIAVVLLAAACASSALTKHPAAARHAYASPLYIAFGQGEHPRAGAAGDVVECRTWGAGGSNREIVYNSGATADSADDALEVARHEAIFAGVQDGLAVAAREPDRVLYVLEVDGVVKQAVIVHDGPASEGAGGPGWYVESWAVCDYSEFPRWFTDSIGLQIWQDAAGRSVPTTEIQSWRGPAHCDWQSMTFLHVDHADYVRDPRPELADYFAAKYAAHGVLPDDAVDTGYRHDGARLWIAADRGLAYVGTPSDVETWPRTVKPLGCD